MAEDSWKLGSVTSTPVGLCMKAWTYHCRCWPARITMHVAQNRKKRLCVSLTSLVPLSREMKRNYNCCKVEFTVDFFGFTKHLQTRKHLWSILRVAALLSCEENANVYSTQMLWIQFKPEKASNETSAKNFQSDMQAQKTRCLRRHNSIFVNVLAHNCLFFLKRLSELLLWGNWVNSKALAVKASMVSNDEWWKDLLWIAFVQFHCLCLGVTTTDLITSSKGVNGSQNTSGRQKPFFNHTFSTIVSLSIHTCLQWTDSKTWTMQVTRLMFLVAKECSKCVNTCTAAEYKISWLVENLQNLFCWGYLSFAKEKQPKMERSVFCSLCERMDLFSGGIRQNNTLLMERQVWPLGQAIPVPALCRRTALVSSCRPTEVCTCHHLELEGTTWCQWPIVLLRTLMQQLHWCWMHLPFTRDSLQRQNIPELSVTLESWMVVSKNPRFQQ